VLAAAAARELLWGLPLGAREVHRWRSMANAIPDAAIRGDALGALSGKRGQTDGAAFFSILPRARNATLLRLLVAYQIMWDFLDSVNESGAAAGQRNGLQLHCALVDAVDLSRPMTDYYRHHPWSEDGGYLRGLVAVCRECCARLPCYEQVRDVVVREARRARVLAINHDPDPRARDATLRRWSAEEFPSGHEAAWFELSGAASAGLTIFALLALASEPACRATDVARTCSVYFPWTATVATMLDSYVDQPEDLVNGDHVYIAHYPTLEHATERIGALMRRCLCEAGALRDGEKHVLLTACMIALYLSKDSARSRALSHTSRMLTAAGGTLTRLLVPILRLWRIAYAQQSS
jgi:tetraprenyl-beta-curcumene synthase